MKKKVGILLVLGIVFCATLGMAVFAANSSTASNSSSTGSTTNNSTSTESATQNYWETAASTTTYTTNTDEASTSTSSTGSTTVTVQEALNSLSAEITAEGVVSSDGSAVTLAPIDAAGGGLQVVADALQLAVNAGVLSQNVAELASYAISGNGALPSGIKVSAIDISGPAPGASVTLPSVPMLATARNIAVIHQYGPGQYELLDYTWTRGSTSITIKGSANGWSPVAIIAVTGTALKSAKTGQTVSILALIVLACAGGTVLCARKVRKNACP